MAGDSQSGRSEHVFANLFARGRVFEAFDEFRGSLVVSPRRNERGEIVVPGGVGISVGANIGADTYAYTARQQNFRVHCLWATTRNRELVERLKERLRESIRKDMLTASGLGISCHSLSQSLDGVSMSLRIFSRVAGSLRRSTSFAVPPS